MNTDDSKKVLFELPDSADKFLSELIDAYPREDFPTLRKVIGLGKVLYQDTELIPGMPTTAAVLNTKPYTLVFGKKFMEENMQSIEDCVYILSHELTHLVLDHFAKDILEEFKVIKKVKDEKTGVVSEQVENLGRKAMHIIVDCQVNATVVNSLKDDKYHDFIKRYYPKDQMPYCFFRPDGEPPSEELKELHKKLYSENGISNTELIEGLLPWFEEQQENLDDMIKKLLGNHKDILSDRGVDGSNSDELSDLTEAMASDLSNYLDRESKAQTDGNKESTNQEKQNAPGGKEAGKGGNFRERSIQDCLDRLDYSKNIKNKLKTKDVISPSSRIFKAIDHYIPKKSIRSVVPNFHDRRTAVLFSKGKMPIFHKRPEFGSNVIVPCYLDVSGSQDHVLDHTAKAVSRLRNELGNVVHCFSTDIHSARITDLKERGKIKTTGGTDFNIIAEHILKNNFKCAVILTDGEAYLSPELALKLRKKNVNITVGWTVSNPRKDPLQFIASKSFFVFSSEQYDKISKV